MNFRKYLLSLKNFIIISSLVFILSSFLAYFLASTSYLEYESIIERMGEKLEPIFELSSFNQFLFILVNNTVTLFLAVILGLLLGIFPLLVLFLNGMMLGVVAHFTPFSLFVVSIVPHGILEIPALILSCAIGLKLGKTLFLKEKAIIKKEIKMGVLFFLKFLLPIIIIAAAIEVYLTSFLLQI